MEPNEARLGELTQMFDALQQSFALLLTDYSDEQLATIADFLTRFVQQSQAVIADLSS